jgi:hypothetical protein
MSECVSWAKGQSVDVDVAAEVPIRTPGGLDMALRLSGRFLGGSSPRRKPGPDSTEGLAEFSHLEIVYRFHLTDPTDVILGARRPRGNPAWPTEMLADYYAAPSD